MLIIFSTKREVGNYESEMGNFSILVRSMEKLRCEVMKFYICVI